MTDAHETAEREKNMTLYCYEGGGVMQDVPSEEYCEGGGALHSYRCPFFVNNGSYCRCHYYGKWLTEAVWTVRRPPECLADFPHGATVEIRRKEANQ